MAISYGAAGTIAYGTTSLSVAFPSGITAGQLLVLSVGVKPSSVTPSTPAGWALAASKASTNTTTTGADKGPSTVAVFTRVADGTETGTVTVTLTSGSGCWGQMHRWSNGTGVWDVTVTTGEKATGGTPWTAVMAATLDATAGDFLFAASCTPTDVASGAQFSAENITATGLTVGTRVEISEPFTANGNDVGGLNFYAPVTAGPATGVATVTATVGSTTTNVYGPTVLLRIREATTVASPAPSVIATTQGGAGGGGVDPMTLPGAVIGDLVVVFQYHEPSAEGGSSAYYGSMGCTINGGTATMAPGLPINTDDSTAPTGSNGITEGDTLRAYVWTYVVTSAGTQTITLVQDGYAGAAAALLRNAGTGPIEIDTATTSRNNTSPNVSTSIDLAAANSLVLWGYWDWNGGGPTPAPSGVTIIAKPINESGQPGMGTVDPTSTANAETVSVPMTYGGDSRNGLAAALLSFRTLPDPIAMYPFNEQTGDTAHDMSGNGYDISGMASQWPASPNTNGGFYPSTGTPNSREYGTGTVTEFTLAAWTYSNSDNLSGARSVFYNSTGYWFDLSGGKIELWDGPHSAGHSGATTITTGWHHLAWTWDGTTLKMYVDHVLDWSGAVSIAMSWSDLWSVGSLVDGNDDDLWSGLLDDVLIYDTALSADQITAAYHLDIPEYVPPSVSIPTVASASTIAADVKGSATSSVPVPSGVVAGSLVVAGVYGDWVDIDATHLTGIGGAFTPPDGSWTLASELAWKDFLNANYLSVWYKYATGSDSGTYDFVSKTVDGNTTATVDYYQGAGAARITGGPTSGNPFVDSFQGAVGRDTLTVATFTPSADNTLFLAFRSDESGPSPSYTSPSGWVDLNQDVGIVEVSYGQQTTAAATGSLVFGGGSSDSSIVLIGSIRAGSATTRVTKSASTAWSVTGRPVKAVPTAWSLGGRATKTQDAAWNVLTPATLLAAYNADEVSGNLVVDYSGNGRHVTLPGSTQRSTGKDSLGSLGHLAVLMGDGSSVGASASGVASYQSSVRAMSAWVYWTGVTSVGGYPFMFYDYSGANAALGIFSNATKFTARFRNTSSTSFTLDVVNYSSLATGWHHFAVSWDMTAGVGTAWVDGVSAGTVATTGTIRTTSTDVLVVDTQSEGLSVDDLRVYSTTITTAQVVSDMSLHVTVDTSLPAPIAEYGFNEGSGTVAADSSGHSRNLTALTGAWTTGGHTGGGLDTDGSGNQSGLSTASFGTFTKKTVMLWYKPVAAQLGTLFYQNDSGSSEDSMWVDTGGYIHVETVAGSIGGASGMTAGTWNHVAYVVGSAGRFLYVNGSLIASDGDTGLSSAPVQTAVMWPASAASIGPVDDLRIFDTALTPDQIAAYSTIPVVGVVGSTRVTKSVTTQWGVIGRITKAVQSAWGVGGRANKSTATQWNVLSGASYAPLSAYNFDESSGPAIDCSGNGHDVTMDAGNRVAAPGGHGGGSSGAVGSVTSLVELAGDVSGVSITPFETNSRSASWWAQVYNTGATSLQMVGWFQDNIPHNSEPVLSIGIGATFATLRMTGANGHTLIGTAFSYTSGWHHFAVTYDHATKTGLAYMDGVLADSITFDSGLEPTGDLIASQVITCDMNGVSVGGGLPIDDVRVYGVAIPVEQVTSDMTTPVTGGLAPTRITKTSPSSWNVTGRPIKAQSSSWNIASRATVTRDTQWTVLQRLLRGRSTAWNVAVRSIMTTPTTWNVGLRLNKTQGTEWTVLSRATKAQATSWAVLIRASLSRGTSWGVLGRLTKSAQAAWGVLSRVTATRSTQWTVSQRQALAKDTAWSVTGRELTSVQTAWNLADSSGRQIKSVSTAWGVLARGTTSRASQWSLRQRVVFTRSTQWTVTERRDLALDTQWVVLSRVNIDRDTGWVLLRRDSTSVDTRWDALGRATKTQGSNWNVAKRSDLRVDTGWSVLSRDNLVQQTLWNVVFNTQPWDAMRVNGNLVDHVRVNGNIVWQRPGI